MGDDDRLYTLDNRVDINDDFCLIINQDNETVTTSRGSSEMSTSPTDVELRNGSMVKRPNMHRSVSSHGGGTTGTDRKHYESVDVYKHCHQQFDAPHNKTAQRQLMVAATMCLLFLIGEFIGGYFANSLAIMTDAAHMLSDFASFLISLFAIWLARRPPTKKLSFGYYRAEILGAVISILIIWVLTCILIYMAVLRVLRPVAIDADVMLITSGIGVLFNVAMAVALTTDKCQIKHGHSHGGGGHSHGSGGHSHGGHVNDAAVSIDEVVSGADDVDFSPRTRRISINAYPTEKISGVKKTKNINVRAALIHVLGDFIQSVGVFIAALLIKFESTWTIADPICTFLFSILVLFTTLLVMRDAVHVLMEGTPRDVDYNKVITDLKTIEGVRAAHSLHMWSLTLDKAALAVHLAIEGNHDAITIVQKAGKLLRFKYSLSYTTIQVEPWDETTMISCFQCVGPQS